MFTREIIDSMDKSQVKAARGLGSLLNDDDKTWLDARLAVLTAPPAPTPFPRQAELDKAYSEWKAWGKVIKDLHTEARAGNHSYVNSDNVTVKPGRARKATITGKAQICIGENVYTSWQKAADGENVKPDLSRTVARNWRPLVMAATTGTVKLTGVTVTEYSEAFPIPEGVHWKYEAAAEEVAEEVTE